MTVYTFSLREYHQRYKNALEFQLLNNVKRQRSAVAASTGSASTGATRTVRSLTDSQGSHGIDEESAQAAVNMHQMLSEADRYPSTPLQANIARCVSC